LCGASKEEQNVPVVMKKQAKQTDLEKWQQERRSACVRWKDKQACGKGKAKDSA